MIARLTGQIVQIEGSTIILDVAGVGYLVTVPTSSLSQLQEGEERVTLITHMIVREDDLSLFGFGTGLELRVFRALIAVNGVGPRLAVAMLSALSVQELVRSIVESDTSTLTRTPGVGQKLAQRVCLELCKSMSELHVEQHALLPDVSDANAAQRRAMEDAIEALVELGYSRTDARRSAVRAAQSIPNSTDSGEIMQIAIRLISAGGR